MIGGDSVYTIERRLLGAKTSPSSFDFQQARIEAEDLFEMKVKIILKMARLHPEGDWIRRGAWALTNSRTKTKEHSLEKLATLYSDLQNRGVNSDSFKELQGKVLLRLNLDVDDEHSAA